jgi:hypothetical protein
VSAAAAVSGAGSEALYKITIAYDKGKLAVRQGRKAVNLLKTRSITDAACPGEIVWPPKAI